MSALNRRTRLHVFGVCCEQYSLSFGVCSSEDSAVGARRRCVPVLRPVDSRYRDLQQKRERVTCSFTIKMELGSGTTTSRGGGALALQRRPQRAIHRTVSRQHNPSVYRRSLKLSSSALPPCSTATPTCTPHPADSTHGRSYNAPCPQAESTHITSVHRRSLELMGTQVLPALGLQYSEAHAHRG